MGSKPEGSRFFFFDLITSTAKRGHQCGEEHDDGVESGATLRVDRDLTTLNEHVIDNVDHAVGTLDIWTDHSSTDVLPLGKVF